jgi:hypothetical protein
LVHGSDTPLPGCPLLKMLETGRCETKELQVPDGSRWLMITADPVVDEIRIIKGWKHACKKGNL